MSEKSPFISVVVPAYNEEAVLAVCLSSLKRQDYAGDYEIIVADNASTDNTAKIALAMGARVVYESKRSPACARHRGLEEAKGDIVAFIDADTQAPSCWLSTLVSRFAQEPKTVVISGPYAYFDAGEIARIASYMAHFIAVCLDQLFRRAFNKGGALWGSNFAVRRSVLVAAGGFDTSIKFYGEEYELSLRLKNKGKGSIIPWLFVLTSARRVKRLGVVTQYWNWIIDYFSVLFWYKPIPDRLEDWPKKAWQVVVASCSWQRFRWSLKYFVLLLCLLWLHTSPLVKAFRRLLYLTEVAALSGLFMYHGANPASQLYGKVCSNGNRNCCQIALTFDDGPNEPFTSQVLDILREYDIKATFFMIGQNVERWAKVCQRVLNEGHIIGNHSYFHSRWLAFNRGRNIARELKLVQEAIYKVSGVRPSLFRPPYGLRTPWLMRIAANLGFAVIGWDNMTNDWHSGKKPEQIVRAVLKRAKPGGIIVLHDGRGTQQTFDRTSLLTALPEILAGLKRQGYELVTVPELIDESQS